MDRNTFFALPSVCTDADLEEQKRIALADQENNWSYVKI